MWTEITDENVLAYLRRDRNGTARALIDDEKQTRPGALWSHVELMARRGLVRIVRGVAYPG